MTKKTFTEKLEEITALVKAELETAPGCHDFDHTLRVLKNAEMLARENPDANLSIVRLAAVLHDIARPGEMAAKGSFCHAAKGAEKTIKILTEYSFPQDIIQKVADCVRKHRFRGGLHPESIEEKIIYDADKLDSIGAVGIGRAFHFAGRENARLHNTEHAARNSAAYSRDDSAYREYLIKLRHVPEKMLTAAGRRIAADRAVFMHKFFNQINQEIFGLDNNSKPQP